MLEYTLATKQIGKDSKMAHIVQLTYSRCLPRREIDTFYRTV